MRGWAIAFVCGVAACGGRAAGPRAATPRTPCAADAWWDGAACQRRGTGAPLIAEGARALAEFRVEEAVGLLEQARRRQPYAHADYAALHAQLGVAYAYLEREAEALAAFAVLLDLEPGYALSYTLSPKATFLFERARAAARTRTPPALDLSWPRDLDVAQPVPVEVEVVADPERSLDRAVLHVRRRGASDYARYEVALPGPGKKAQVELPALATGRAEVLQLWATGVDPRGNEVLLWAGPERPREIALEWEAEVPWYRRWWVWAAAGGVVAASTGAGVYVLSREPPDTVGGGFSVER